jgi:hypothetical protein
MREALPLYTEVFEYGKWRAYSTYEIFAQLRGDDLHYAIVEYRYQQGDIIGGTLQRVDDFINGQAWSIVKNGNIIADSRNRFNQSSIQRKTEWSLTDQVRNSLAGQILSGLEGFLVTMQLR